MQKVIVGVDGSPTSRAAVEWCAAHVDRDAEVIAISGLGPLGEFVIDLPGFDMSSPKQIRETFRRIWCSPLERAGLRWQARFVQHTHPSALADAIEAEQPDLVVIGKPDHVVIDLLLQGKLQHTLHHARCPVVIVPAPQPETGLQEASVLAS